MNYLFKFKSLLVLCAILQACSSTDKAVVGKANKEIATSDTTDQTKKKGIVLIDDNGKLGDLFKSGGDEPDACKLKISCKMHLPCYAVCSYS